MASIRWGRKEIATYVSEKIYSISVYSDYSSYPYIQIKVDRDRTTIKYGIHEITIDSYDITQTLYDMIEDIDTMIEKKEYEKIPPIIENVTKKIDMLDKDIGKYEAIVESIEKLIKAIMDKVMVQNP